MADPWVTRRRGSLFRREDASPDAEAALRRGWVYLVTNCGKYGGFTKVGMTTKEPAIRALSLIERPPCEAWAASSADAKRDETFAHRLLSPFRIYRAKCLWDEPRRGIPFRHHEFKPADLDLYRRKFRIAELRREYFWVPLDVAIDAVEAATGNIAERLFERTGTPKFFPRLPTGSSVAECLGPLPVGPSTWRRDWVEGRRDISEPPRPLSAHALDAISAVAAELVGRYDREERQQMLAEGDYIAYVASIREQSRG